MAKYLLDTQYLIWFQGNNPDISSLVLSEITNTKNAVYFSQISLFEIAIKQQIGKLPRFLASVSDIYDEAIKEHFTFLPIHNNHILNYRNIPLFTQHRDPFNRLIIATAYSEKLTVITSDKNFNLYNSLIQIL